MASYTHRETRARTEDGDEARRRHHDRHDRHIHHDPHDPQDRHERHKRHGARHHSGHGHGTDDRQSRHLDRHEHRHHRHRREEEHRRHDHDDSRKHHHPDRSRERDRTTQGARDEESRNSVIEHDRPRDKHRGGERHRERHSHADKSRPLHHSRDPKHTTASNDTENLYALDTRGDPLIRHYGTNDRANVPAYYRLFNGRAVLGSDRRYAFRLDGIKELFFPVPRFDTTSGSVLRDSSHPLVWRILHESEQSAGKMARDVRGAAPEKGGEPNDAGAASQPADFVPVSFRKQKRKRGSDTGSERGGSKSRGWPLSPLSSSGSSSDSSSDDDETGEDDAIDFVADDSALETTKQKLAQLSRQIREHPEDVSAWLALADLQEDQARLLGSTGDENLAAVGLFTADTGPQTTSQDAAISAVKLSIFESALRQVKLPADRDLLQLALLREAPKVWSRERVEKRWADLTERHDASFAVWRARLDHDMTSLLSFNVDRLVDFCSKRLRHLEEKAEAKQQSAADLLDLYTQMVYIFLRATRLLYDAGFCDKATAAWQALFEMAFARPVLDDSGRPEGNSFEKFWDSELPRIGDDKAEGWRSFANKARSGPSTDDMDLDALALLPRQTLPTVDVAQIVRDCRAEIGEAADLDECTPLYRAWAVAERRRGALAKLPARVTDEVDDDGYEDVFRVVMFSDIKSLLFTVPPALLPALQPFLFDAFLLFCQLPPAFGVGTWIEAARNDPFLAVICLSTEGEERSVPKSDSGDHVESGGRQPPDLGCDGSQIAVTADVLFPQPGWFRYLPRWLQSAADDGADSAPVPPRWVANVLRQLVRSFGVGEMALYSLAVDAAIDPAGLKRTARTLLRQYLSDTSLYNAYALAEASRGHAGVARSVLASAAASTQDVEAELSLRQTWAWVEMEALQLHEALRRLVLSSSGSDEEGEKASSEPIAKRQEADRPPLSPAQLLRARHTLRTGMDYSLSAGQVDRAALFAQSYVMLAYLATVPPGEKSHPPGPQHAERPIRGDVGAALAAATVFSDELQARGLGSSSAHERFLQGTARIVLFHARRGSYRPADLQAPLQRFVTLFPRNGLFLRLFAWIDPAAVSGLSRLRPDDPLQQILDSVVLVPGQDCPSSRAFVIRLALQQARQAGADHQAGPSRHAARAAFERTLGGRPGKRSGGGGESVTALFQGSAQLWQAYVHLTVSEAMAAIVTVSLPAATDSKRRGTGGRGTGQRKVVTDKKLLSLAKTLYYRAVRACPWSKAVYLEGFGALASPVAMAAAEATTASGQNLTAAELRGIVNQMVEMRLRLHIDPDAVHQRARAVWEQQEQQRPGRGSNHLFIQ